SFAARLPFFFISSTAADHSPSRSFPTRRSSDLHQGCRPRSQGWSRPRSLGREGGLNDMTDVKTVDVLDAAGAKAGSVDLPAEVFGVAANVPLIHQVVVAQLAAASFFPLSCCCCFRVTWNFPITFKSSKMINSYNII